MAPNLRPITRQGLSKVPRDHLTSTDRAIDQWARQGQQTDRRLEAHALHTLSPSHWIEAARGAEPHQDGRIRVNSHFQRHRRGNRLDRIPGGALG